MKRRQWLAAGGVAAAAAAGGIWWSRRGAPAAVPDAPPWNASFTGLDGQPLAVASFHGQPLVLNFWATWCEPCLREMPAFDRFAKAYASQGWQVLGVAIDQQEKVKAYLQHTPVSYSIAIGSSAALALGRTLGNAQGALPFTVIFGTDGQVIERRAGETHYEELEAWARRA